MRHRRENNPNILGYKYEELIELDTIEVELVPEKKGILLKHNEYHVSSKVRRISLTMASKMAAVWNTVLLLLLLLLFILFCFALLFKWEETTNQVTRIP